MAAQFADTSFLISLYGNDAHSNDAWNWVHQAGRPIAVTTLGRYEFTNALYFAAFRKAISRLDAQASLAAFDADLKAGLVYQTACDFAAVLHEAIRLSHLHTFAGGHRSFDVLHVAAAHLSKADTFLTFDANQRKLVAAVGLKSAP